MKGSKVLNQTKKTKAKHSNFLSLMSVVKIRFVNGLDDELATTKKDKKEKNKKSRGHSESLERREENIKVIQNRLTNLKKHKEGNKSVRYFTNNELDENTDKNLDTNIDTCDDNDKLCNGMVLPNIRKENNLLQFDKPNEDKLRFREARLPRLFPNIDFKKKVIITAPVKLLLTKSKIKINYKSYEDVKTFNNYVIKSLPIRNQSPQTNPNPPNTQPNNYTFFIQNKSDIICIQPIMTHRINWSLSTDKNQFNFLWKYSTKKVKFSNYTQNENKIINLFESHEEITNKRNLFLNMLNYCNMNDSLQANYDSFVEMWDFLQSVKGKVQSEGLMTNKKYSEMFRTKAMSSVNENYPNVQIYFPEAFIDDTNYWIVKANDLFQGRCMKLLNDKAKILKKVKKFFMGIEKTFEDSDAEGGNKLIKPINNIETKSRNKIENKMLQGNISPPNKIEEKPLSKSPPNKPLSNIKKVSRRYVSSSVIIQKYLEKPLVYKGRKFDIRLWVLVDHMMNVHMFKEGHLKASSELFDMTNTDPFIHLTNYSVQKYSQNFSKYEYGNEIPFCDLVNFLKEINAPLDFHKDILPQIKEIIDISMNSVFNRLNKRDSKFCFQIFGYDLIIDKNFKVWLLEINDNPGLSESSPLIKMLVPRMIDDAFRLTIDKVFNTQYTQEVFTNGVYNSRFPVDGYTNSENLFEFVCNIVSK